MRTTQADEAGARAAADTLRAGGVVVVPTDTVYGLAARPGDAGAVGAIFRIKDRPEGMPLPVLAASTSQVQELGVAFTRAAGTLARSWWPGPLTLVFGFETGGPRPRWLDGRDEVALRVPDHAFLRTLLAMTGVLLVTSANRHGDPTPTTAADVAERLGPAVDLVVDGGALTDVPSTLVNVRGSDAVVEREGAIPRVAVAEALAGTR
jgi:L-threonylcarbamoyladenylate synthase